jgi:phenylalanyl-tRNA synthetase beta chain
MNISYSWLKDYVDFNLTPEQLGADLTSIGLECGGVEKVETIKGGLRGLVIGHVLSCEDHPDSDHLHVTRVDMGGGVVEQIVCGAPNVAAGQTVVVATVGTTLYDGDKEFKIKKSKIRGVESMGMICAEDEIGVGTSHAGIIVIDQDIPAGTPAAEYYNIHDDYVLEVDITPNRIDAASHYGVARDLAARMSVHSQDKANLRRPSVDAYKIDDASAKGVTVTVEDQQGCVRYSGVTIEGVNVTESPEWLKDRLSAIGVRPINNIVDITNYLLHAMGQPLHCFDRAKIKGDRVIVKTVPTGTKFTTLDEVERELNETDVMICNESEPMCIAGVFGGLDSGVTTETKSVFLESACFNPTRVRRTARRHGLSTDSSFRFERGVDPNNTLYVLKLAALMVKELAGGTIVGETVDVYPNVVERPIVELDTEYMTRLVGKEIPAETIDTILAALEIETLAKDDKTRRLAVPTYRVDVTRPCDVVEDVLRIYGYNNVEMPGALHASLSFKTDTDSADDMRRLIAQQLTAQGFNEILNNSLTAASYYNELPGFEAAGAVSLLNPLSQDLNVLRRTMLFGGLETLSHNINRKSKDLALYETGNVYFNDATKESTAEHPLAPYSEDARLALWMTGDRRAANWTGAAQAATVYDLKSAVYDIFSRLGISLRELSLKKSENPLFDIAADISTRAGKFLGTFGVVAKKLCREFDIKQDVFYAELEMSALVSLGARSAVKFSDLPKTHPVRRDLALLIDKTVTMADIEAVVRESERRLLSDITLFDVYEGEHLPQDKKSYAIAITLQDNEKTLQDKYIEQVMNKIVTNLKKRLGAELR